MNRHSWIKVQKSGENILRGKAWHRKLNNGRDAQTSYPPKAFRRHQKDCPGRIQTQKCQRQKEDEDNKGLQGLDLCVLTALWPHLTLSTSSDNSLLSWPRLPLIALVTLRLYFFSSSIKRSSEHFCLCCWSPPWRPTSTQQPGLSPPGTTEAFPLPFTSNSFLVLDWLDCEPFGVHN